VEQTNKSLKVGDEIPSLTKTAYMPVDSNARNVIHTDEYAKNFGMRGALIGGSTLLSYILEMLYNYFGKSWFYYGKINVSFIGGGAINGDIVTAHGIIKAIEPGADGSGLILGVYLENQMQEKIVVGEARCLLCKQF
jgi:hypothetical protein